jgi:3',5'-cyclic AMP phosphodiesterase CpdA
MLLAQFSDVHLGPLPRLRFRDFASKRVLGSLNWRRNRRRGFGPAVLAALIADMRAAKPDHVAVTGDLVNLGLASEIDAARDWLATLGGPKDVTVIPGNHDAYVRGAVRAYHAAWHPYMTGDGALDGPVVFPFLRRRGPVALIALSSAISTAPLMATGRLGATQAKALADLLGALGEERLCRVVLIHHPPIARATHWHRRLIDAGSFLAAIREAGAELILHGHNHRTSVGSVPGPKGEVPVVGAHSASVLPRSNHPGGSYNLFRIEGAAGRYRCAMTERGIRTPDGPVETISERRLFD